MNSDIGIAWNTMSLAVIAALVLLAYRKSRARMGKQYAGGSFIPKEAPSAGPTARIVEATTLAVSATIIITICSTWTSTGGLMLMLDQLQPEYAMVNIIMFAVAVIGAFIAVLITLFGRSVLGTIVLATVLIGYGTMLNGGSYPGSMFVPEQMVKPTVEFTIDIGGTNVEGAELWVNGVCLGKTPYTTTLKAFEEKVPYWPEPPADYDTDKVETKKYSSRGTYTSTDKKWIRFELPEGPSRSIPGPGTSPDREQNTYYARVRYAGEWGLGTGK